MIFHPLRHCLSKHELGSTLPMKRGNEYSDPINGRQICTWLWAKRWNGSFMHNESEFFYLKVEASWTFSLPSDSVRNYDVFADLVLTVLGRKANGVDMFCHVSGVTTAFSGRIYPQQVRKEGTLSNALGNRISIQCYATFVYVPFLALFMLRAENTWRIRNLSANIQESHRSRAFLT